MAVWVASWAPMAPWEPHGAPLLQNVPRSDGSRGPRVSMGPTGPEGPKAVLRGGTYRPMWAHTVSCGPWGPMGTYTYVAHGPMRAHMYTPALCKHSPHEAYVHQSPSTCSTRTCVTLCASLKKQMIASMPPMCQMISRRFCSWLRQQ
jgi:hypothetical protein